MVAEMRVRQRIRLISANGMRNGNCSQAWRFAPPEEDENASGSDGPPGRGFMVCALPGFRCAPPGAMSVVPSGKFGSGLCGSTALPWLSFRGRFLRSPSLRSGSVGMTEDWANDRFGRRSGRRGTSGRSGYRGGAQRSNSQVRARDAAQGSTAASGAHRTHARDAATCVAGSARGVFLRDVGRSTA